MSWKTGIAQIRSSFTAKAVSEVATNRLEDQELSVLALLADLFGVREYLDDPASA